MTRPPARTIFWSVAALGGLGCSAVLPPGFGPAPSSPVAAAGAPSFQGEIVPTLKKSCGGCHATGGMAARYVELFDADGAAKHAVIKARGADIVGSIKSGRMPLGMPKAVSPEEIAQLEAWVKAGAPEHASAAQPLAVKGVPVGEPVTIKATDFGFAPQRIQVPAGRKVRFVFENKGVVNHDWIVPALGLRMVARAGEHAVQELTFDKPGEYDLVCSLPFHAEFGMKGKVSVVADPGAPVMALEGPTGVPLPPGLTRLPVPAMAPPIARTTPATVPVEMEAREVKGLLGDGVGTTFWTFDGTVPGPMVRVRLGDTVQMKLKNALTSEESHSIDFHATTGPGGGGKHTQIPPGATAEFSWKALNPGVYVYHCATPKVGAHIANGMYGLIVVEPPGGWPKVDREFYLMQGEFYLKGERGTPGMREFSWEKLLQEQPEFIVMNGSAGAVTGDNAFKAKVGETVRFFFGVGGPNITSSFHMIGEIFDRVWPEGASESVTNVQTTMVPAGGATIADVKLETPGAFPLVDHSLGRLDKGCAAILAVEGEERPDIFKPGPRLDHEGKPLPSAGGAGGGH